MTLVLSILFGSFVGFALGLTGGGGSLLAVPLLVYGLSMGPREAFSVSLAAVGTTALVGVIPRWRSGQVEIGTGILFAGAGMVGAPFGTWTAQWIAEPLLLLLFATLMLLVAWRMLWATRTRPDDACSTNRGPCQRTAEGRLKLSTRCGMLLVLLGVLTGFLSGMFGVGGGFVIVPALVLFSSMSIHRAVGTSLLVIVLVSVSGVTSHVVAGQHVSWEITALFVVGGIAGLTGGSRVARHLSGRSLQRVFAFGIVLVAAFVVGKTLV